MSFRLVRRTAFATLIFLLGGVAEAFSGTDLAQDVRDLHKLEPWHVSEGNSNAVPAQTCGISGHPTLRLDLQVAPGVSDSDANSQISALDRKVTAFLTGRSWSSMKIVGNRGGIPDLTRCSHKQSAVAQIYKTTSRCTMGSPCTVYDGFTVALYLPQATPIPKGGL